MPATLVAVTVKTAPVAVIAHELNTPLATVRGYVGSVAARYIPPEADSPAGVARFNELSRESVFRYRADWERLRMAMTAGWQTSDTSSVRLTVQDEFEHVGFYLGGPLYLVVPVFYELLEDALAQVYGVTRELPRLLRFATWVGGDMDGNPNVGADTIAGLAGAEDEGVEGGLHRTSREGRGGGPGSGDDVEVARAALAQRRRPPSARRACASWPPGCR